MGTKYHIYLTEIAKDGQQARKIKFLKLAEKALTQLSKMRGPVESFSEILRSIVEDKGIFEYQYGVFFMLYAQFQRKYKIEDDQEQFQTAKKMKELIADNDAMLRNYDRNGKKRRDPLPIYIRNAIVHHGTNQENTFTPQELRTAIEFLRKSLHS